MCVCNMSLTCHFANSGENPKFFAHSCCCKTASANSFSHQLSFDGQIASQRKTRVQPSLSSQITATLSFDWFEDAVEGIIGLLIAGFKPRSDKDFPLLLVDNPRKGLIAPLLYAENLFEGVPFVGVTCLDGSLMWFDVVLVGGVPWFGTARSSILGGVLGGVFAFLLFCATELDGAFRGIFTLQAAVSAACFFGRPFFGGLKTPCITSDGEPSASGFSSFRFSDLAAAALQETIQSVYKRQYIF